MPSWSANGARSLRNLPASQPPTQSPPCPQKVLMYLGLGAFFLRPASPPPLLRLAQRHPPEEPDICFCPRTWRESCCSRDSCRMFPESALSLQARRIEGPSSDHTKPSARDRRERSGSIHPVVPIARVSSVPITPVAPSLDLLCVSGRGRGLEVAWRGRPRLWGGSWAAGADGRGGSTQLRAPSRESRGWWPNAENRGAQAALPASG